MSESRSTDPFSVSQVRIANCWRPRGARPGPIPPLAAIRYPDQSAYKCSVRVDLPGFASFESRGQIASSCPVRPARRKHAPSFEIRPGLVCRPTPTVETAGAPDNV
jgi:hypothetical protein